MVAPVAVEVDADRAAGVLAAVLAPVAVGARVRVAILRGGGVSVFEVVAVVVAVVVVVVVVVVVCQCVFRCVQRECVKGRWGVECMG